MGALEASLSLPASLSYSVLSAVCQPALSACPYLTVFFTDILVNKIARRVEGGERKYFGGV
jgi:hypothetical protein